MITLFKNITHELTDKEKSVLVPMLLQVLLQTHTDYRITGNQLCIYMNAQGHHVSGVRIRKMINFIRVTNAAKPAVVIGAGNGYFITTDPNTIAQQIESVKGRIDSMNAFIDTMQAQMGTLKLNNA